MNPLSLSFIENIPKLVQTISSFRITVIKTQLLISELELLTNRVTEGKIIPDRFYRKDRDTSTDRLLEEDGIMHLHLGSKDSSELLYLMQFSNRIIFLEVSDHYHFSLDPPGTVLKNLHGASISQNIQDNQKRIEYLKSGKASAVILDKNGVPVIKTSRKINRPIKETDKE